MAIGGWRHLDTFRTQKLSILPATIVGQAPVKIAGCRVKEKDGVSAMASSFLVGKRKSFYRGAEFVKVIRGTK